MYSTKIHNFMVTTLTLMQKMQLILTIIIYSMQIKILLKRKIKTLDY